MTPSTEDVVTPARTSRMGRPRKQDALEGPDTRTRLLEAAMSEFIESGFAGTDTNRIARRAGFAPQTFYRWFEDKFAVFADVLAVWEEVERSTLLALIADRHTPAVELANACVENARPFLTFRQHLRAVQMQHAGVRELRMASQRRLLALVLDAHPAPSDPEQIGLAVWHIETLSEALARGDLADMGLGGSAALAQLARAIDLIRGQ
jgi:AcrR family transcriptional regulator